jgi:hypothetical protein
VTRFRLWLVRRLLPKGWMVCEHGTYRETPWQFNMAERPNPTVVTDNWGKRLRVGE